MPSAPLPMQEESPVIPDSEKVRFERTVLLFWVLVLGARGMAADYGTPRNDYDECLDVTDNPIFRCNLHLNTSVSLGERCDCGGKAAFAHTSERRVQAWEVFEEEGIL